MAAPGRVQRPHLPHLDRQLAALRRECDRDRPGHRDPGRLWAGVRQLPGSQAGADADAGRDDHACSRARAADLPRAQRVAPDRQRRCRSSCRSRSSRSASTWPTSTTRPRSPATCSTRRASTAAANGRPSATSRCRWPSRSSRSSLFFSFVSDWNNFFLPYAVLANSSQYPIQVGLSTLLSSTPSFNPAVGRRRPTGRHLPARAGAGDAARGGPGAHRLHAVAARAGARAGRRRSQGVKRRRHQRPAVNVGLGSARG